MQHCTTEAELGTAVDHEDSLHVLELLSCLVQQAECIDMHSVLHVQGLARPCGRSGHGMALTVQADKAVMVVHGGRSKGDVLHNDTWLLELPALEAAV